MFCIVNGLLVMLLWQAHQVNSECTVQCTANNQLVCYARDNPNSPLAPTYARTPVGRVYPNLLFSQTVGVDGPILFQDNFLIEKLQRASREKVHVRIAHAKGAGAFGHFKVTHDVRKYTRAAFLQPNAKTQVVVRFSSQVGEAGSSDTAIDAKGFAVKFKTTDGIFDFVGLNLPAFSNKDPFLVPDLLHSRVKNPVTHLQDLNMFWDMAAERPETLLFILFFLSKTAYVKSYSYIDGHAIHTFKLVNAKYKPTFAKFILTSNAPRKEYFSSTIESLTTGGIYPEFLTQDLYDSIANKQFPSWTLNLQVMTEEQAKCYKYSIFDPTKYWNTTEFPLIPVGKLVLDRNPTNYFNDVEQAAFSPGNLVPGIEPTPDRILQARMFAYRDAQFYRIGTNHDQIPVNSCPFAIKNYIRDGFMSVGANGGSGPNYFPNSYNGPTGSCDRYYEELPFRVCGDAVRDLGEEDNFSQCKTYLDSLCPCDRRALLENLASAFTGVNEATIGRVIENMFIPVSTGFAKEFKQALKQLQQQQQAAK